MSEQHNQNYAEPAPITTEDGLPEGPFIDEEEENKPSVVEQLLAEEQNEEIDNDMDAMAQLEAIGQEQRREKGKDLQADLEVPIEVEPVQVAQEPEITRETEGQVIQESVDEDQIQVETMDESQIFAQIRQADAEPVQHVAARQSTLGQDFLDDLGSSPKNSGFAPKMDLIPEVENLTTEEDGADILGDLGKSEQPVEESKELFPAQNPEANSRGGNVARSLQGNDDQENPYIKGHAQQVRGKSEGKPVTYNRNGPGEFKVLAPYDQHNASRQFSITDHRRESDHFVFQVEGVWHETRQPFQVMRRFKHFYALREWFVARMPGLYIPPLPKKKTVGNANTDFLQERQMLLNRFIKQMAKCPYLVESEEFKVFIFPQQTIEKQLEFMANQSDPKKFQPMHLIQRVQPYYQVTGTFTTSQMAEKSAAIFKFGQQAKRMQTFLVKFIDQLASMQKKFDDNLIRNASLNKFIYEYELSSVLAYSQQVNTYLGSSENLPNPKSLPEEQLLFENSKNATLKEEFDTLHKNQKNPFLYLKLWQKYEIYDIDSILHAIEKRSELEKKRNSRANKRAQDVSELNKLELGKFSIGSVFSNKTQIQKKVEELKRTVIHEQTELQDWDQLLQIMTSQLADVAIPFFKKTKFATYYRAVDIFANQQVRNIEQQVDLFTRVMGTNQTLIDKDNEHWEKRDRRGSSRIVKIEEIPSLSPQEEQELQAKTNQQLGNSSSSVSQISSQKSAK